ncbi:glycosyltransferase [Modicisalibacter xianhensis]|uniref:Glycosyltransferase like family 2 n=1 Tax=Modicisalibacter xianhensis TaxID=442341 RepID=A0A1I3CSC1_9GAMM|nr:glycosyltransferase [Halomonas xianhensis]SFH77432.1 Glycosyltransferase like family 2 [Halomonas xianhensis]
MIGVVVPVHNEQDYLAQCLESLSLAVRHPGLVGEHVVVVVVLDNCNDASAAIAEAYPVETIRTTSCNVGVARHEGARLLLDRGARWLAFTDADTCVQENWLVSQCQAGCDAVCGDIRLIEWECLPSHWRRRYLDHRRLTGEGRHVHGANLGVSADAYRAVGGFPPLRAHEDVMLVHALKARGFRIAWNRTSRVMTSARREARAPEGLGSLLATIAGEAAQ